ncbi:MAG: aldehyde dehydrogenase family protein [Eubacterium sp.]|nr:aldehyde dehydrogenase family protein [Eubacterium sp.]
MEVKKMFIDGEWVLSSSGKTFKSINPSNGETLAEITEGTVGDVRKAVSAAKKSFYKTREWRDMDSQTRGDYILKIADAIDAEREEFAEIDSLDHGKPLREAECDVDDAIHTFRYYASLIKAPYGGVYDVNEGFGKMHSYTIHEPVGVCGLITPWNYPLLMGAWKLAPALAAGNSIIYKPSSNCVLSSIKLFEIFEKVGLPKGCANLVLGPGGTIGNEIAENNDIDMVTFTGSTEVGQSIMRAAAGNVKKIGLELGGKSPNVIFADSDLDGAVEWAMVGIFLNQGEICSAGSRIIVEESIHDEFVKRLAKKANAITIGNPLDNPDMGPLVSESHMNKVLGYIKKGIEEGAELVCGGERYTEGDCAKGYYLRPTVFDRCTDDMTIVKEEIFGPVVTVQTFKTEQEAIDMANNTEYGLAGAVFTSDGARALRVIKEIRAGITWINCYNPCFNEAPWGGYKKSGIGRELGIHGLEEYQEIKQININLNPGVLGWYEH